MPGLARPETAHRRPRLHYFLLGPYHPRHQFEWARPPFAAVADFGVDVNDVARLGDVAVVANDANALGAALRRRLLATAGNGKEKGEGKKEKTAKAPAQG